MSQYVNFFIKSSTNEFIPIGDFSRNSDIYKTIKNYIPYNNISAITKDMVRDFACAVDAKINEEKSFLSNKIKEFNRISSFNNSIQEKQEYMRIISDEIEECRERADDLRFALHYFKIILCIIEAVERRSNYTYNKNS